MSKDSSIIHFYIHRFSLSIIPVSTDTTVQITAIILYLQLHVTFWKEDSKGMRISDELVTWYSSSRTCPYMLQTVAQPDYCATKFKPVWKSSNCCTNSQTTPHTIKLFAQQSVLRKRFACVCTYQVTGHNTPIHNILSTAPQLSISQKALGTLPEDDNVMPKHVGSTIHN
jgi:hypothetical protein